MDGIDEYYYAERAFIGRCGDIHALADRMSDYRGQERIAIARGLTKSRLRLTDLLELAENRVAALKARTLQARATTSRRPPQPPPQAPARTAEPAMRDDSRPPDTERANARFRPFFLAR